MRVKRRADRFAYIRSAVNSGLFRHRRGGVMTANKRPPSGDQIVDTFFHILNHLITSFRAPLLYDRFCGRISPKMINRFHPDRI